MAPKVNDVLNKARKNVESKRYKKAREMCEGLLKEDSGNREALRISADIHFRNGKWESALGLFRRVVECWGYKVKSGEDRPNDLLLSDKIRLARCLIKFGDYEEALDVLEEVADVMKLKPQGR